MITRMQIALRDGVGTRRSPSDPWYSSRNKDAAGDGRRVYMAWGLIEATPGTFEPERCYPLSHATTRTGLCMGVSTTPEALAKLPFGDEIEPASEVSDAVCRMEVAASGDPLRSLIWEGFGKLLLRRTNFPVSEGHEAFVAAGILVGPRHTPTEALVTLEAVGNGLVEIEHRDVPEAFERGQAGAAVHRHAIWGFEGPQRGFASTMRQDVIDACERYRSLEGAERDEAEEREFATLGEHPAVRSVLGGSRSDAGFAAFRRFVRGSGRDAEIAAPFDGFPTALDEERRERATGELMREWFAERGAAPRYG